MLKETTPKQPIHIPALQTYFLTDGLIWTLLLFAIRMRCFCRQLHKLYKLVSGFMIDPQTDYKHEHLTSLTGFFKVLLQRNYVQRFRGQTTQLIP
jgi:hypothetical protein